MAMASETEEAYIAALQDAHAYRQMYLYMVRKWVHDRKRWQRTEQRLRGAEERLQQVLGIEPFVPVDEDDAEY